MHKLVENLALVADVLNELKDLLQNTSKPKYYVPYQKLILYSLRIQNE